MNSVPSGSMLSLRRNRLICTSTLRSKLEAARPRARSSNWSRLSTRCGRSASASEIEFCGAQRHQRAGRREQLPPCDIEAPAAEFQRAVASIVSTRRRATGTPQHRAYPRQQFAGVERFCEIIVCAHFEADDTVGFAADRRQHDNRNAGIGADAAAQVEAAFARQHHVQNDQIDPRAFQILQHTTSIVGDRHAIAVLCHELRQQGADFLVVVDDEKMLRHTELLSRLRPGRKSRFL